jgi:hypothetical protein
MGSKRLLSGQVGEMDISDTLRKHLARRSSVDEFFSIKDFVGRHIKDYASPKTKQGSRGVACSFGEKNNTHVDYTALLINNEIFISSFSSSFFERTLKLLFQRLVFLFLRLPLQSLPVFRV